MKIQVIKNILSIDLEDHYCDLPFSTWHGYQARVSQTTRIILDLLEKYRASATFFTVGYIAERHPELIEEVRSMGHEIASHSYSHPDLRKLTRNTFEDDLSKSQHPIQAGRRKNLRIPRTILFNRPNEPMGVRGD